MTPLFVAIVGLLIPNALFLYWHFFELDSVSSLLGNHLGVALFVDAVLATGLLAYLFALRPPGGVRWPWLLVLTALGGGDSASGCCSG
jgi:hypothetical protein